jgi:hypothetical protein
MTQAYFQRRVLSIRKARRRGSPETRNGDRAEEFPSGAGPMAVWAI